MLDRLDLKDVGPVRKASIELAQRLNVITGDNGVGKSFILDIAWWALTRTWPGYPARPRTDIVAAHDAGKSTFGFQTRSLGSPVGAAEAAASYAPSISYRYGGKSGRSVVHESLFDFASQEWPHKPGRPGNPGFVLYAQVDGSFSVWDPARNYWKDAPSLGVSSPDRPPAYLFEPKDVWNGLTRDGKRYCNGLISDWAFWQNGNNEPFTRLCNALVALSPSLEETLQPGALTRISLDDSRPMPTLRTAYGQDVAIVHASAGVRRVLGLAYLLVWAWQEHLAASQLLNSPPARQVLFLIDEIEAHLHPRWQRTIIRSLLDVVAGLAGTDSVDVQVLAVTHSPLVLASLEPIFDPAMDALWHFELESGQLALRHESWRRRGDANAWLISDLFKLGDARSLEGEKAVLHAEALMLRSNVTLDEYNQTRSDLHRLLPDVDPFLVRWRFWAHEHGFAT